jgi:hypothetical protein
MDPGLQQQHRAEVIGAYKASARLRLYARIRLTLRRVSSTRVTREEMYSVHWDAPCDRRHRVVPMAVGVLVETAPIRSRFSERNLSVFAESAALTAGTLARAHARSLDPAVIRGYLGKGKAFREALVSFARDYTDGAERDHERLVDAIQRGEVPAEPGI